jgi:hypothetical protein
LSVALRGAFTLDAAFRHYPTHLLSGLALPESDVLIVNNLTQRISQRDQASGTITNNLEQTSLDFFVDALAGDFHPKPSAAGAIDQGRVEAEAGIDLDGDTRRRRSGPRADEYRP